MIQRSPDAALLRACERGECATVTHFEQQLEKEFPDQTRELIEKQINDTKKNQQKKDWM